MLLQKSLLGNTISSFLGIKISKGNDKIDMSKRNIIFNIYKTATSFKGNERAIKIKQNEKALTSAINTLQQKYHSIYEKTTYRK